MPDVRMPDGTVVRFPDDMPQDQIKGMIAQKFPEVAQPKPSVMADVAQSGVSGVRSGIESSLGMFGDANRMSGDIAGWVAGKLGAGPDMQKTVGSIASKLTPTAMLPSTAQIQGLTNPVMGEGYKPQTVAGEYANTIGEFIPGAMIGPGGVGRKAAMAVIPAVVSETAGQLTKGTGAEPYARFAGGLAGGVASAGLFPSAAKNAAVGAPTREAVKQQTDDLYGALRNAGIKYDGAAYEATIARIQDGMLKEGLRPSVAKEAFGYLDDLKMPAGHSPDFSDISGIVQSLGEKSRSAVAAGDRTAAKAFDMIADGIRDFEMTAPMTSATGLAQEQVNTIRKTARGLALKNIKSRALEEIVTKSSTYAAGEEAGIRNGINNLLRSKYGQRLFNEAERTALLQVSQGRKPLRSLSRFGLDLEKISGNATFLPTIGAVGAGAAGGPLVGAGLLAAGTAAKALSPRLTQKALEQTGAAIRSGKLGTKELTQALKDKRAQALIRAAIAAESAKSSASVPPLR